MRALHLTVAAIGLIAIEAAPAGTFEVVTHELINENAVSTVIGGFSLDGYLKSQLNLSLGIAQPFDQQSVSDWIRLGGKFEDSGIRFFHHFHDPLKPWTAKLTGSRLVIDI